MIKVCYRLWVDDSFIEELPKEQYNELYGIDEDCNTKREWLKAAKETTDKFNLKFGTAYTYQDFFGECEDIGWRRCTICGESFWNCDEHECY